ncbi:MAG: DnaJ domain-containing protein [Methylovulum sp.]|nr:DnaJ domain-containing protein [Methylovulum sp.]
MRYKDYYKVMGLSQNANQDEIKQAYRKLARQYHPDVSTEPDAEAKFKALREAYEVLKDIKKRVAYDRLNISWKVVEIVDRRRTGMRASSLEAELLQAIMPEHIVNFLNNYLNVEKLLRRRRNSKYSVHKGKTPLQKLILIWKGIFM